MYKDLSNQKFGKLTAIKIVGTDKSKRKVWLCQCDCGNQTTVVGTYLSSGNTTSCGCIRRELNKTRAIKHGNYNNRLYKIWYEMKRRCYNKNRKAYKYYGAKGISICDEWLNDYMNFRNWALDNGYNDTLTIERIDYTKNYCPENCTWITQQEQTQNSSHNHYLTLNDKTMTITQWSIYLGMAPKTIRSRLKKGWKLENVLSNKRYTGYSTFNL